MKKTKLVLLAVAVIFAFCSKNQKVVKQLDGTWKITSMKENGVEQPDSLYKDVTYKFEKCRVKKGPCDGSMSEAGKTVPFTYDITDKGTKITITISAFGVSETSEIVEHSKTKFVWKTVDGSDETETTIEKQ